ncbi:MAG TPA: peroxiredoxin [Steroidobacteraceae bacterium]|jgi:peroxiredoxin Q/BCP|nr:peroxiredoxin [Steroidobacteraceae bacterium]
MSAARTNRAAATRKSAPRKSAPGKSAPGKRTPAKDSAAAAHRSTARPAVTIGQAVADFSLPATGGARWRLKDARGRKLVLYFYPRDNTPGCTLEGQQFAALTPRFERAGVTIVGISRDSLAAHEKFRQQMNFPFLLLSDADSLACKQFDVIREKNMYGRKIMGIERSTFLLDAQGVLRNQWRKLKVDGHALQVLEAAQAL